MGEHRQEKEKRQRISCNKPSGEDKELFDVSKGEPMRLQRHLKKYRDLKHEEKSK